MQSSDLEKQEAEIDSHIESRKLSVFRGRESAGDPLMEIEWTDPDWTGFFDLAQEHRKSPLVKHVRNLERSFIEEYEDPRTRGFLRFVGKKASIEYFWTDGFVKYALRLSTPWWEEFLQVSREKLPVRHVIPQETVELPRTITRATPDELASHLLEFVRKQVIAEGLEPSEVPRAVSTYGRYYWEMAGIPNHFLLKPEHRLKIDTATRLASERWARGAAKDERKVIQDLFPDCVDWAKSMKLKRVTKSNIDYFLSERDISLSRPTRDILYNKVNLALGQGRR